MMYLTKGDLYHTSTWKLWFQTAEGYLPLAQVQAACRNALGMNGQHLKNLCRSQQLRSQGDTLAKQHLFSVYVHVGLNNRTFTG
jgi:hypothetical protein